ncbi:hypothetical protein BDK51DRAFT_40250, partial [Blyttiomyces helicus]
KNPGTAPLPKRKRTRSENAADNKQQLPAEKRPAGNGAVTDLSKSGASSQPQWQQMVENAVASIVSIRFSQ